MRMWCEFAFFVLTNIAMTISEPMMSDEEKRLYNFGLGKRAYSYVSEYKRLPVYNFGLGKRFEGKNIYSFGLGKRNEKEGLRNRYFSTANKRGKSYNFGLGKRLSSVDYDIRFDKKATPQYSIGLGKRLGHYNFGLGKRQDKYLSGLEKKDKAYSFGLGKRYSDIPSNEEEEHEYENGLEVGKQKEEYAANIGERYSSVDDMDDQRNQSQQEDRDVHYEIDFDKPDVNVELPIKSISQAETEIRRQ